MCARFVDHVPYLRCDTSFLQVGSHKILHWRLEAEIGHERWKGVDWRMCGVNTHVVRIKLLDEHTIKDINDILFKRITVIFPHVKTLCGQPTG